MKLIMFLRNSITKLKHKIPSAVISNIPRPPVSCKIISHPKNIPEPANIPCLATASTFTPLPVESTVRSRKFASPLSVIELLDPRAQMRKRGRKTDFRTLGQEEKFRESRESLYSPKVLTSSRQRNDGVIQRAEVKRSKRKEEKREREELARVEGVGFVRSGAVLMITSGFAITTTLCRILLLANLKRDETQTG